MKVSISSVASFVVLLSFNQYAQTSNEGVKFRLVQDYLIVVPVHVSSTENDSNKMEFVLDTGTSTSIITPEAAAVLQLKAVDRVEMVTPTGSVISPRSYVPQLRVGEKTVERLVVIWNDLRELRTLDKGIAGILGQNFLSKFNYLIDYRSKRLEFIDAGAEQFRGSRLPVEFDEDCAIVTTPPQSNRGKTMRLVLDSAASNLILFGSRQQLKLESVADASEVATNAGRQRVETGVLEQLRLANESLSRVPVAFLDVKPNKSVDGLLPSSLFRTLYFNNQDKYVVLNPR